MKINQQVKFFIATNDSDYASNLFGVEAENDWFDIQFYPEQIKGIIIWNKGLLLAQHIYNDSDGRIGQRGKVYDISKNGIKLRIEDIKGKLDHYDMSISDFYDDEIETLDAFFEITLI